MDRSSFRPLAGFWFLNSMSSERSRARLSFPSPCGVLVLKWSSFFEKALLLDRFRPLAGFWFLNDYQGYEKSLKGDVSVPLRGSGS